MGGQGWPPKLVRTWLDRAGTKDWLGVLMVFREWECSESSHTGMGLCEFKLPQAVKEGVPKISYQLDKMFSQRGKGKYEASNMAALKHQKMDSDTSFTPDVWLVTNMYYLLFHSIGTCLSMSLLCFWGLKPEASNGGKSSVECLFKSPALWILGSKVSHYW